MSADRSLQLLRHSARVSPILQDAVGEVEAEMRRLRAALDSIAAIEARPSVGNSRLEITDWGRALDRAQQIARDAADE